MSFFEKNLTALQKYDEVLYQQVLDRIPNLVKESKFFIHNAKNGEYSLIYNDGSSKKNMLSSYNPSQEAERWVNSLPDVESYIIYGFGLAYHLPYMLQKTNVEKILIIEPELDIFILALKHFDLNWLWTSDIIELSIGEKSKEERVQERYLIDEEMRKKNFHMTILSGYTQMYQPDYLTLQKHYSDLHGKLLVWLNTLNHLADFWTDNFFENLKAILISSKVKNLFNKFQEIPVVIISAGPSLNKNVHLLHELKDKAVLLCVATAYKVLQHHDIKPDLIVSYDGGQANHRIFLDAQIKDIPLVFDPSIYSDIIKDYEGHLIVANINKVFFDWIEKQLEIKIGDVDSGPSVANVCLDLARKIGGNPIIFVGQDLAYTEGKTHAANTIYEKNRITDQAKCTLKIEDIYGNQVMTGRSFLLFLQWFEQEIAKSSDRVFIDATEGGAKIAGTKIMPLRDVIDQYCIKEYPITQMIHEALNGFVSEFDPELFDKVKKLLDKIIIELNEYKEGSEHVLALLKKLEYLNYQFNPNQKIMNKIVSEMNQMKKKILSIPSGEIFLRFLFYKKVFPLINGSNGKGKDGESEQEKLERLIQNNTQIYSAMRDNAEQVLDSVEKARQEFE